MVAIVLLGSGAGCEVGSVLWSEELQLEGDGVGDGCSRGGDSRGLEEGGRDLAGGG